MNTPRNVNPILGNRELMALHVATGYRHDPRHRLDGINDWVQRPVPRFWLGRTGEGAMWRFRSDLPDALCGDLEALCRRELPCSKHPSGDGFTAEYAALLGAHAPIEQCWGGPTYWFANPPRGALTAVAMTPRTAHLLRGGLEAWRADVAHQQPFFAVVVDGMAVAVCASVRITDRAHAAGVETLAAYRHRGLATQVVAAWAAAVMREGRVAFYSTSWDNQASQRLAVRAGATIFGEEYHLT